MPEARNVHVTHVCVPFILLGFCKEQEISNVVKTGLKEERMRPQKGEWQNPMNGKTFLSFVMAENFKVHHHCDAKIISAILLQNSGQ